MSQQVEFQLRRGLSSGATGWSSINPILLDGEPGFELDTGKMKIGFGGLPWNSLPYLAGSGSSSIGITGPQGPQGPTGGISISGITPTNFIISSTNLGIGNQAGSINQGSNALAIGTESGVSNQGSNALSIGNQAGNTGQSSNAIALGSGAASNNQSQNSVAIGYRAGNTNQGGTIGYSVAMGYAAGYSAQGNRSIAIGSEAGYGSQGNNSIAIGNKAGVNGQPNNTIILTATGNNVGFVPGQASSFYVAPIRNQTLPASNGFVQLWYNPTTNEIAYG